MWDLLLPPLISDGNLFTCNIVWNIESYMTWCNPIRIQNIGLTNSRISFIYTVKEYNIKQIKK